MCSTERDYRQQHWGGQPLPFAILLDPDGEICRRWRLNWSVMTLLIDPDGKPWGEADEKQLAQAVAGQLPPVKPERVQRK